MKKLISAKLAGTILIISFGLLMVFHVLVLLNILPPDIVWGGQAADSGTSLLTLELIALSVTAIMALIVAAKIGYFSAGRFKTAISVAVWFVFAYLLLNTLGNLASGVSAENFVFTPITFIMALLALRLAIKD